MAQQPCILIARSIFPETVARLQAHCEVETNPQDVPWSPAELAARLADKDGARQCFRCARSP